VGDLSVSPDNGTRGKGERRKRGTCGTRRRTKEGKGKRGKEETGKREVGKGKRGKEENREIKERRERVKEEKGKEEKGRKAKPAHNTVVNVCSLFGSAPWPEKSHL